MFLFNSAVIISLPSNLVMRNKDIVFNFNSTKYSAFDTVPVLKLGLFQIYPMELITIV